MWQEQDGQVNNGKATTCLSLSLYAGCWTSSWLVFSMHTEGSCIPRNLSQKRSPAPAAFDRNIVHRQGNNCVTTSRDAGRWYTTYCSSLNKQRDNKQRDMWLKLQLLLVLAVSMTRGEWTCSGKRRPLSLSWHLLSVLQFAIGLQFFFSCRTSREGIGITSRLRLFVTCGNLPRETAYTCKLPTAKCHGKSSGLNASREEDIPAA